MNIPGHLAVGYLLAGDRTFGESWDTYVQYRLLPVSVGALSPDIIDKTLMLAGVYPWGRTVGHSLLVWALMLVAWAVLHVVSKGETAGLGFFVLGGLSHLGADFLDDLVDGFHYTGYAFSAWFGYPLTNPDMWEWHTRGVVYPCRNCFTVLEIATVALAWYAFWKRGHDDRL